MEINWDVLINGGILIFLAVWFISKLTKQTIAELLGSIKDFITGTNEEAIERGEQLLYYD